MIDKQTEIIIEEVLLGYLRSSKQIDLSNCDIEENDKTKTYTLTFTVDKDFGVTLSNSLNNQFLDFFNKNSSLKPTVEITPHRQRGKD